MFGIFIYDSNLNIRANFVEPHCEGASVRSQWNATEHTRREGFHIMTNSVAVENKVIKKG